MTTVDEPIEPRPVAGAREDATEALADGDRPIGGTALSALRHHTFRRVFIGASLSNVGSWMQNVVLGALAYDLTESASFVGVMIFAQLGPVLLFAMVGGLLADMFDRRRLLITVAVVQTVLSLGLAAVVAPEAPNRVAIIAIVFLIGTAQAVFMPTYSAILPGLVGTRDLAGAISLNSAQMNGSRVIGPIIGAFLDDAFGASSVFAVNAASYLFVIAALAPLSLPAPAAQPDEEQGFARLAAGVQAARRNPVVKRALITISLFSLLALPFVGQLPVVAHDNLGIDPRSSGYGALFACFGLGALLGALAIGTVFAQHSKPQVVRGALVAFGVALAVFALVREPALAYPVVIVVGFTYFAFITSLNTVLQHELDARTRGRVMALWMMGFGGTVPVGNLLAGPVIEATSITAVMLGGAVIALALAVLTDVRRLSGR